MFNTLLRRNSPTKKPITRQELLEEYALTLPQSNGKIITFDDIGDKDAYNPSFILQNGQGHMAVRVESRASKWQTAFLLSKAITRSNI